MSKLVLPLVLVLLIFVLPLRTSAEEGDPLVVTFQFVDEDVRKVVQMVASYANANVILDPALKGEVTLSFKAVPWRDALEAIVASVGGALIEEDGPIYRIAASQPSSEESPKQKTLVQLHDAHDLLEGLPDLVEQVRALPQDMDVKVQAKTVLVVRGTARAHAAVASLLMRVRREQAMMTTIVTLQSELSTLKDEVSRLRAELDALKSR